MKKNILFSFTLFSIFVFAQSKTDLTQEEKEAAVIDYSNIKKVLKNDGLLEARKKQKQLLKTIKSERKQLKNRRDLIPPHEEFFSFMSELWLVRNAQVLRWDFPKPQYGIAPAFKSLLERFGYYNYEFKILIVNSPTISHFALPYGPKNYVFLLSLPFMRSLDLTKVDISLLLLEDFLRLQNKMFEKNLGIDFSVLGTPMKNEGKKIGLVKKTQKAYSKVIFESGFNFQQQFQVTKEIDRLLKSSPSLWGAYFKLYKKIDRFIKNDLLFKHILKIYPSPELQLQWLSPKKKVI